MRPDVTAFFDDATNTVSFVVKDPEGRACAIIDSVLDFDYSSGHTNTTSADAVIAHVVDNDLTVDWILESMCTRITCPPRLPARETRGKIGIGKNITLVQDTFGKVFNEGTEFERDGSQFDQLFEEGDSFMIGQMRADVLHTPGHTPACSTYVIGDAAFVGDTLFMPDFGTARCDFPAARQKPSINPFRKSSLCQTTPGSLSGMTTRRPVARNSRGKPQWPRKKQTISTSAPTPIKRALCKCAMRAMQPLPCPN